MTTKENTVKQKTIKDKEQPVQPQNKQKSKGKSRNKTDQGVQKSTIKYKELEDKYLRLSAEFDNYRKRTLKEKMDLIKTAGEDILINVLPVLDDFERAIENLENADGHEAVKEGVLLIYKKFKEFLNQRGVKEIESINQDFDSDFHEAVSKIPAPDKKLKGKVVDVVQKGYILDNKVIRYSKVVIGE